MGSTTKSQKKIVGSDKFAQLLLNVNNDLAATKTLDTALEKLVSADIEAGTHSSEDIAEEIQEERELAEETVEESA